MSISHYLSRGLSDRVGGGRDAFETRDFYLACFLRCSGYDLIGLRAEGQRKVFVFRDRPTRRDDVLAFYGDGAAVPPLAFSSTIKDMKALCTMPEIISPLRETCYSEPVRSALDLVESLLVEGLKHGHFDYSLTCELGTKGRRLLIVKAGKTHKFTIEGIDVPR